MQRSFLSVTIVVLLVLVGSVACVWATPLVSEADPDSYPLQHSLFESNRSFKPSRFCITCHQKQFSQWNGSAHSLAFWDPVYRGESAKAAGAAGQVTRQCDACHSPVGALGAGLEGTESDGISDPALSGVLCDVCHSASSVARGDPPLGEPGSGPLTLTPVIDSTNGPTFVRRGPFQAAGNCDGGFHGCLESGLQREAELCGSCHRGTSSGGRHPLGACYAEWERGPYAQKSILCQDCHMVDIPTFKRSADCFVKPGRQEYRHYFSGVNYQLAYLGAQSARQEGDEELARSLTAQYQMALERLKSAAELVLIPLYHDGKLVQLTVRVKNIRAGHNLPAALSETRQMWLELTVRDESGALIGASGATRDAGDRTGGGRSIQETIPPRGYREVSYGMELPAGVKKIGIEAKLCLRQTDRGGFAVAQQSAGRSRNLKRSYGQDAQLPLTLDLALQQATLQTILE